MGDIKDKLLSISWDFTEVNGSSGIHSIHPYPAKFIQDIPSNLMETLPIPEGTAIFDPFCGSGATLVEAQKRGIPSVGVDLNPIACLLSKVKTSNLPNDYMEVANSCIVKAQRNKDFTIPKIPNLDHWFKIPVQEAVASLLHEINKIENTRISEGLMLGLSSILVRVSNQESNTRYAAIDKNIQRADVYTYFRDACKNISLNVPKENIKLPDVQIINKSIMETKAKDIDFPIGLLITSPPYPNAYEYWLYHKYRMWWLGFDPIEVKEKEIGARVHFFKKNPHTKENFCEQMNTTFKLVNEVLVSKGYACFVIGRSIIKGEKIDNGKIIIDVASKYKLNHIMTIPRKISQKRKSFNLSHAKIKEEEIIILQKIRNETLLA